MKIEIKSRWGGKILFSLEAMSLKVALEAAVHQGAYLRGADLEGAYLKGAYLKGADLEGADLEGAYLEGAYLRGVDLRGAYLKGADLRGAYLKGADLEGAYLRGADLEGAYLRGVKKDFLSILDAAPAEVAGLRKAIMEGRVNGSAYEGECACLLGTIANVRGCKYNMLENITPNSNRPAETWFMMFRPGKKWTPKHHDGAKITLGWIDEWLEKNATAKA